MLKVAKHIVNPHNLYEGTMAEYDIWPPNGAIRNMADELEIPASAFEVKASYFERPNRALVRLILQYINQFGTPHLWWGHTHTPPVKGAKVTFLGKYTLPESHHKPWKWAPCPCCSLHHPKYFRSGLIAWFPEEGVIRCVGDQCYKRMDPEGYALAMRQLNIEIKEERTAQFLLSRIPRIPEYVRVIKQDLPIIEANDKMRNAFLMTLNERLAIDLWPHANTGMLRTTIRRNEVKWRQGAEEIHTITDFQDFGSISGHIALKPGKYNLASKLRSYLQNLTDIFETTEGGEKLLNYTETEKNAAVKVLSWAHTKAGTVIAEAEEVRRFFQKVNAATINKWSEHENSPAAVHLVIDDECCRVGRHEDSHFSLKWPPDFWLTLQTLEPLSQAKAA